MTPAELFALCRDAIKANTRLSLVVNKGMLPAGFPRGELLCEGVLGPVRSYDPDKILAWMARNDLVEVPCV